MRCRFRLTLTFLTLAVAMSPAAQAQFDIGGLIGKARTAKNLANSLRNIGEQEEILLGSNLAGLILSTAPLINHPAKQRYINRLGSWLAMHSERPGLPWRFGIIDSDNFNAFSAPGGHVLITRGLFDRMRNESELAGVLSHEIAHVVKKHHLAALQKGMGVAALSDIGELTGATRSGGGITGIVTAKLLESGKEMFIRGLDKDDEYEADRMAVVLAARAGYSPYGLAGVLQTLSAEPVVGRFSMMSKTHPTPVDRLERLGNAMGTKLDSVPGVVDDLPSFVALRNAAAQPTVPQSRKRRPSKSQ
jgi:beta-barrel assembly-enhancing protease